MSDAEIVRFALKHYISDLERLRDHASMGMDDVAATRYEALLERAHAELAAQEDRPAPGIPQQAS